MPIINLTIKGKQAISDNTKIVCMNSDYVVRLTLKDCDTFETSPFKKLIVRYGRTCKEAPIQAAIDNGQTVWQAALPMIVGQSYVELGVVGKETDTSSAEPIFASRSAKYDCAKSVMCGIVAIKEDPQLTKLAVLENGIYKATDKGVDGFYEVDVAITSKYEEERVVDLVLADGDQLVAPSGPNRTMKQVTVRKPMNLTPENIRKDINICGIIGNLGSSLGEKEITVNGEYIARADGVDGFNVVRVNVPGEVVEEYDGTITTV